VSTAEEGIKLFAFHGKLNEEIAQLEGGTWSKDILSPTNGRWVFEDKYVKLKKGDTVYYWTYVDYFNGKNTLGYTEDAGEWTVTGLYCN
jgi:gram-negative bacteria-binding protein 3